MAAQRCSQPRAPSCMLSTFDLVAARAAAVCSELDVKTLTAASRLCLCEAAWLSSLPSVSDSLFASSDDRLTWSPLRASTSREQPFTLSSSLRSASLRRSARSAFLSSAAAQRSSQPRAVWCASSSFALVATRALAVRSALELRPRTAVSISLWEASWRAAISLCEAAWRAIASSVSESCCATWADKFWWLLFRISTSLEQAPTPASSRFSASRRRSSRALP
mmetsp:Transcript_40421/g.125794  ORF Transcript_40421/g.125794 Transcript_40421/m.125794 type:complete len:222 (-) Transcript_40421:932-1597(-)